MDALSLAFFRHTSQGLYIPGEATIGPWSPEFQHGGPPSALLTHALRTYHSGGQFNIARITIEILGAVPLTPCEVRVEVVRGGKRVQLLKGEYLSEGKTYLVAHAWRFLSEPGVAGAISDSYEAPLLPEPQEQKFFPGVERFPYGDAMEWRFTAGGFDRLGPATVWARPRIPLIADSEMTGLEALMLMIDSANGVSAELDILKWTFVPVDLTVGLYRQPEGAWVGMDARTVMEGDGIGQTTTVFFDRRGKLGRSMHTLFIRPR